MRGFRHQPAADGEHLLLPAGKRSGGLRVALLQDREIGIDHLLIVRDAIIAARIGAHADVLGDGEQRENLAAFRHMNHPAIDHLIRLAPLNIRAFKLHRTLFRIHHAGDRLQ